MLDLVCFERGTSGVGFENNYFTEICSGSEAGSYLRLRRGGVRLRRVAGRGDGGEGGGVVGEEAEEKRLVEGSEFRV